MTHDLTFLLSQSLGFDVRAVSCYDAADKLNAKFDTRFRCQSGSQLNEHDNCTGAVEKINAALPGAEFVCGGTSLQTRTTEPDTCTHSVDLLNADVLPPPGPPPPTPPPTPPPSPPSPPTPPTCDECFYCGVSTIFNTRSHAIDAVSSIYVAAF